MTLSPAPRYQRFWCEENIWHLSRHPQLADRERYVVFITNEDRACPFWQNRAAADDHYVVWDYHVVLLVQNGERWDVWDLDTRLPQPLPLREYLQQTFPRLHHVQPACWPRFRVIAADTYVAAFSSDRSHMAGSSGEYLQPPPPWPPIHDPVKGMNLPRFLDLETPFVGQVVDVALFAAWFKAV